MHIHKCVFHQLFVCLLARLSERLSVPQTFHLYTSLSCCLYVYQYDWICTSVFLSIPLSVCPFIYLSFNHSVSPSIVHLYGHLSVRKCLRKCCLLKFQFTAPIPINFVQLRYFKIFRQGKFSSTLLIIKGNKVKHVSQIL